MTYLALIMLMSKLMTMGIQVLMTDMALITIMSTLMTMTMQNAGVDDRPGTQPRDWIPPCSTGLPKDDRSRP